MRSASLVVLTVSHNNVWIELNLLKMKFFYFWIVKRLATATATFQWIVVYIREHEQMNTYDSLWVDPFIRVVA